MNNLFPFLIIWGVSILLFALLQPNFIFNIGKDSNSKCKVVKMPDPKDPNCPSVPWSEFFAHLGLFALLEGLLLFIIYTVMNTKLTQYIAEFSKKAQAQINAASSYARGAYAAAVSPTVSPKVQQCINPAGGIEMVPMNTGTM
jgi:hypothetical protein